MRIQFEKQGVSLPHTECTQCFYATNLSYGALFTYMCIFWKSVSSMSVSVFVMYMNESGCSAAGAYKCCEQSEDS